MASFSVLRQPWIPVVDQSGTTSELSLWDVVVNAHSLRLISDPSPAVEFGIHRLVIAFVIDAFGIRRYSRLVRLIGAGRFDADALMRYVTDVGESRFNLFDPDYPFLQVSEEAASNLSKEPVTRLMQHIPSGSFWLHFHHQNPGSQAFAPAVCARALATVAPFMTAGGAGHSPSINGTPPWYVLVLGTSLFETLMLNCCAVGILGQDGDAPPSWREAEKVTSVARGQLRDCDSICAGYTWRPRSIRLIPGPGGTCSYSGRESDTLVREMGYGFGAMFRGTWQDPSVAYITSDKGSYGLRPTRGKELWRDTGPLALLRRDDYKGAKGKIRYSRPALVDQYLQLQRDGYLDESERLNIAVYGMRTDQMKVFEWWREELSLPSKIAGSPWAAAVAQHCMDLADTVSYHLSHALKICYPRQGKGNKSAFDTLISRCERDYWATLRPLFDHTVVEGLLDWTTDDAAFADALVERWLLACEGAAVVLLNRITDELDADSASMARAVEARRSLALSMGRLKKTLHRESGAAGGEAE